MQDSTLKAFDTSNASDNHAPTQSTSTKPPSLSLLEEGLLYKLEVFAMDVLDLFENALKNDWEKAEEQINVRMNELIYLRNEVQGMQWLKANNIAFE